MKNDLKCIIVEGAESPEKREMIKRLSEQLKWNVRTLTPFPPDAASYFLLEYQKLDGIIIDKSHIAHNVESKYWYGKNVFSKPEKKALDKWCSENGILVIVSIPPKGDHAQWPYQAQQQYDWNRLNLLYWLEGQVIPHFAYRSANDFSELMNVLQKKIQK